MCSPFFVTANDTPNHPQKERRNMAFRSMFFMGLKLQLVEIHLFPTFTIHCKKIPFATPSLQLLRVSLKYLTIYLICTDSRIFPNWLQPKSCGNVRIWQKKPSVRRKSHEYLKKSFGMNINTGQLKCVEALWWPVVLAPVSILSVGWSMLCW